MDIYIPISKQDALQERAKRSNGCDSKPHNLILNCIINHLLFVFESMLEDIKMKPEMLINF